MHPQSAVNWKRSSVYEQLGFDRFLSIEDFESAPVYHSGATDASTYDKILELLEQDAAPQFIFDVTMQNHSGYGEGSVPAEDVVTWMLRVLTTRRSCLSSVCIWPASIGQIRIWRSSSRD